MTLFLIKLTLPAAMGQYKAIAIQVVIANNCTFQGRYSKMGMSNFNIFSCLKPVEHERKLLSG
jgi:hypothetical protein